MKYNIASTAFYYLEINMLSNQLFIQQLCIYMVCLLFKIIVTKLLIVA